MSTTEPGEPYARYRGTRVVVLGATGFIGRWLAHMLHEQGARLCLVVRDQTLAEEVFCSFGVRGVIVTGDLVHPEAVRELLQQHRPVVTFNLAGYGVDRSERDESPAYQVNAHLVTALCKAVAERRDPDWPGQDLVHVGSALEYGTIRGDLREDSIPRPTTLYGRSKLAGTRALTSCCTSYGIKGLTARLFTVYGPGEHLGRLLPLLLETARTGHTLELTGGLQRRDFTFVRDVAEGLLRLGLARGATGRGRELGDGATDVGAQLC